MKVSLRVPRVGAVDHSLSLPEVASNVRLGKQVQRLRQNAETARKENLASLILQEPESVILVHMVTFSQRKRQQRCAPIVQLGGRKRARENLRANIWAASCLKIAVTMSIGYRTKPRLAKVDACRVHLVDLAWAPLEKRASVLCSGGPNVPI